MQGYTFQNEQQAIKARQDAADYKGYPIRPGDTTIYWVNYSYSELDGFYYIRHVEGLEAVFGQPTEFEVIVNDEP